MTVVTVEAVQNIIEAFAPASLCEPWDNSGLLVGNPKGQVAKILVTLDVTAAVVESAIAQGCQLIVSHHPLIFSPLKQVVAGDFVGEILQLLIKNQVALIAAHTNLDNASGGVNFALANCLQLTNCQRVSLGTENPSVIGDLPQALNRTELIQKVKQDLQLPAIKATVFLGASQQIHSRIAVCGGAGADFWVDAKAAGATCLLTAEGKHHLGIEAANFEMLILDGGHYGTEKIIVPVLAKYLQDQLKKVEIIASCIDTDPWEIC